MKMFTIAIPKFKAFLVGRPDRFGVRGVLVVSDFWKRCGFYRKSTHVILASYKNSPLLKRLFLEMAVVSDLPLHLVKGRVQKPVHRLGRAGALAVIRITVVVVTQESQSPAGAYTFRNRLLTNPTRYVTAGAKCVSVIFEISGDAQSVFVSSAWNAKPSPGAHPNLVTWTRARTGNIFRRDTGLTHMHTGDTPSLFRFICQRYFRLCNPEIRQIFEMFAWITANN